MVLPPLPSKQPKDISWKSIGGPIVVEATGVYLSLEETTVSGGEVPRAARGGVTLETPHDTCAPSLGPHPGRCPACGHMCTLSRHTHVCHGGERKGL